MGKKAKKKVVVLPCSGIGKTFGSVARETTYELVDRLRPGVAVTTCLPLLVVEDEGAVRLVRENPVITIDGCPNDCARKSVEAAGGRPARSLRAINFYKAHKDLKPEGIAELNEAGQKLAEVAAHELCPVVDELAAQEDE
jgi:uncharacterized metal-binding protein